MTTRGRGFKMGWEQNWDGVNVRTREGSQEMGAANTLGAAPVCLLVDLLLTIYLAVG